ncbi:MAG TPA: aldehyde dehydrogenase family protein [Tepidisphaeraceae bacterium]|nr:aldehyde dehydrogenase family protein [Tepidisphaeraceae bacterium]
MSDAIPKSLKVSRKPTGTAVGGAWGATGGKPLVVKSPIDGRVLAEVTQATPRDVESVVASASEAFKAWRTVPAPKRGEFVRRVGEKLRERKVDLATLVSLEVGKITQEALGEVQEMIDICDFAVGLSRQLYGLTIASERPGHRMMEQYHPLGPIGVITAFNFPVAVWAWNAMIAWVCGDPVVWKPSEKTPLTAIACQNIVAEVMAEMPEVPAGVSCLVIGGADVGEALAASEQLPLISATGSVRMGRAVAQTVAKRLGRSLLELGGNNGMILSPSADLELATRAIVFAAAGTAGQRCTTLRRLIVHESVREQLVERLRKVFDRLPVGDPRQQGTLIGPLIDEASADAMNKALDEAKKSGGTVHGGQRVTEGVPKGGTYVRPAVVEITPDAPIVKEETFAPILYVMGYKDIDEAIAIHNDVPQGLSSAIFTADVREAERFLSPAGSDCGIANVNIGTSGAEIGGAFGGEKVTGGGRESGSDAWKAYMRRVTNTVNYSTDLPLAQGISFDV